MATRRRSGSGCQCGVRTARACSCRSGFAIGCPHAGRVEEQRRVVEGERRLGAFIVVQLLSPEPVAAAARREVVERLLQAVAAQEPLECSNCPDAVLGVVSDSEGTQLGFDERGGVERLLVAGAWRRLASAAAVVPRKPERVLVEPALVAEPAQRLERTLGELRPVESVRTDEECLRQPRVVVAELILEPAPILRAGALIGFGELL